MVMLTQTEVLGSLQCAIIAKSREISRLYLRPQHTLFRYKRLLFGLCSSSEIFQQTVARVLSGLEGVINLSDDILVHGSNPAEHNRRLHAVIERLCHCGLALNKDKIDLNKNSVIYYGHQFSAAGVSVDKTRIKQWNIC